MTVLLSFLFSKTHTLTVFTSVFRPHCTECSYRVFSSAWRIKWSVVNRTLSSANNSIHVIVYRPEFNIIVGKFTSIKRIAYIIYKQNKQEGREWLSLFDTYWDIKELRVNNTRRRQQSNTRLDIIMNKFDYVSHLAADARLQELNP